MYVLATSLCQWYLIWECYIVMVNHKLSSRCIFEGKCQLLPAKCIESSILSWIFYSLKQFKFIHCSTFHVIKIPKEFSIQMLNSNNFKWPACRLSLKTPKHKGKINITISNSTHLQLFVAKNSHIELRFTISLILRLTSYEMFGRLTGPFTPP